MDRIPPLKNIERKEKATSAVEVYFFRHSIKEQDDTKHDKEIELTQEGHDGAREHGHEDFEYSIAYGSPRARAQKTSLLHMAGQSPEMVGQESLQELKELVNKDLPLGSKIGVDERLDFGEDPSTEYYRLNQAAFKEGRLIPFLVNDSDRLAKELGDKKTFTYSRSAANVATMLSKYASVGKNWDKILKKDSEGEKKYKSDTLKRFLGTHQTIPECFLAKVMEKAEGKEKRDEFLSLFDGKGFDYNEGFKTRIENSGDKQKIIVSYKKEIPDENGDKKTVFEFEKEITPELIQEIIEEGKE